MNWGAKQTCRLSAELVVRNAFGRDALFTVRDSWESRITVPKSHFSQHGSMYKIAIEPRTGHLNVHDYVKVTSLSFGFPSKDYYTKDALVTDPPRLLGVYLLCIDRSGDEWSQYLVARM